MSCGPEACDEAPDDDAVLRVTTASRYVKSIVRTLLRSKPTRLRRTLVVYREENPRRIGERTAQTFRRAVSRATLSHVAWRLSDATGNVSSTDIRKDQRTSSDIAARATVRKTYAILAQTQWGSRGILPQAEPTGWKLTTHHQGVNFSERSYLCLFHFLQLNLRRCTRQRRLKNTRA